MSAAPRILSVGARGRQAYVLPHQRVEMAGREAPHQPDAVPADGRGRHALPHDGHVAGLGIVQAAPRRPRPQPRFRRPEVDRVASVLVFVAAVAAAPTVVLEKREGLNEIKRKSALAVCVM